LIYVTAGHVMRRGWTYCYWQCYWCNRYFSR